MKHIEKRDEPESFTEWKALASENWQPAYIDIPGEIKNAVKSALMVEQGYICCYCESRLTERGSHIEHFRPQSDPTVDPLNFKNMFCSCQSQTRKGEPLQCGHRKGDWFDQELLVSPLDPNCEDHFAFMGNGEIMPRNKNDQMASETISRLGLNIPKLNDMRAKMIEPFLDDSLSPYEFRSLVIGYLKRDESESYGAFWTTILYLFGEIVAA